MLSNKEAEETSRVCGSYQWNVTAELTNCMSCGPFGPNVPLSPLQNPGPSCLIAWQFTGHARYDGAGLIATFIQLLHTDLPRRHGGRPHLGTSLTAYQLFLRLQVGLTTFEQRLDTSICSCAVIECDRLHVAMVFVTWYKCPKGFSAGMPSWYSMRWARFVGANLGICSSLVLELDRGLLTANGLGG